MSRYTISNKKMNNAFSFQQISRTSNLFATLITRQYKLNLMADFMWVKYKNPKLKQPEIANQLGYSTSTLRRHRNDIYKCFLLTEFNEITPINEQKRLQTLVLATTHIASMTSKDLV